MRKTLEVFPSVCAPQRAAAKEPESRSRFLGVAGVGGQVCQLGPAGARPGASLPSWCPLPSPQPQGFLESRIGQQDLSHKTIFFYCQ